MNGTLNKQPLLSICIPTFNRKDKLRIAIDAFIEAIKGYEENVELIVSDNNSKDGSYELLQSNYSSFPFFRCYKNNSNLGFNRNMFLLVDKYAQGKYCWVIGDDDYVDKDAVKIIVETLQNTSGLMYLSINYRLMDYELCKKRRNINQDKRIYKLEIGEFAHCIDTNASEGNLLCTFMSSSIFYRNLFIEFPKNFFSKTSWDNYYSCFPNAYLMVTLYHDKLAACINDPLLTIVPDSKDWDDKLYAIYVDFLPSLFVYFMSLGISKRKINKNYSLLMKACRRFLLKRLYVDKKIPKKELTALIKLLLYKLSYI